MKKKMIFIPIILCVSILLSNCGSFGNREKYFQTPSLPEFNSISIRPSSSPTTTNPNIPLPAIVIFTSTPTNRILPTINLTPFPVGSNTPTMNPEYYKYWTTYSNTTYIMKMAFDSNNRIWTLGSGGLESWDTNNKAYKKYHLAEGLSSMNNYSTSVRDMIEGPDGQMWFITANGIARFDGEKWTFIKKEDGLIDNNVTCVSKGPDGSYWFGTNKGISRYFNGEWTNYTQNDGLPDDEILSIAIDLRGRAWISSKKGISMFDGMSWKTYSLDQYFYQDPPFKLVVSPDGSIWGAAYYGLLHLVGDKISMSTLGQINTRFMPAVSDIAVGLDGKVWVSTSDAGILWFDGKHWVNYSQVAGFLEFDGSSCLGGGPIQLGPDRALWFGTSCFGVVRLGNKLDLNFNNGLICNCISTIAVGKDQSLWFGAWNGSVTRFDGTYWKTYPMFIGNRAMLVDALKTTSDGDIWVGGFQYDNWTGGLFRFHNQEWITYTTPRRIGSDSIRAITEGPNGVMWFGTNGYGVVRFDGVDWQTYTTNDGLVDNHINGMVIGSGGLFMGSDR